VIIKFAKTAKLTAKRRVQKAPTLWRFWLDFRHALRMLELTIRTKSAYFNKAHVGNFWDYTAEPHQERNFRVLQALDSQRVSFDSKILEIGCSEGVFTAELAKRFARVNAIDLSDVACARAKIRCEKSSNVTVSKRDICREPLKSCETFDVVAAMDVWDYMCRSRRRLIALTEQLNRSLNLNGLLILTDCRMPEQQRRAWWQRWFPCGADAHFEHIQATPGFSLVWRDVHDGFDSYPTHLLAIFRKTGLNS
jgi:cyclopropane fatty-acyl-phospholipid synthase-like methyltransferase